MKYNVLGSSSAGNGIIYHDEILVDVGLPYKTIYPFLKSVNYILLTHHHGDHFKLDTIARIARERPDMIWIIPEYLSEKLKDIKIGNVFLIYPGNKYRIGRYTIEAFDLYHDVPNVGYKIITSDYKIVHATDTGKIDHVEAKEFDLYAIEWNHDIDLITKVIQEKIDNNLFSHEIRVLDTHLSFQKAHDWIQKQKGNKNGEILKLHVSDKYEKEDK
jgi:phosphoribosyl 1,2-cyclic phosphodiesterase